MLVKDRRCFVCMKLGHLASKYRNDLKCYKCRGRHHVAVCTFKPERQSHESENSHTTVAGSNVLHVSKSNSVLLQTARAQVCSPDERYSHNFRILFHSGSQQTYISPLVREILHLKASDRKNMSIKTFGHHQDTKSLEVVKFAVKSVDKNMSIYVNAFVSDICYPVENQQINLAQERYEHLEKLPLADDNPESLPMEIDILIGANHYWDFINQRIVRGHENQGPVAISSKLGYILSGTFGNLSPDHASNSSIVSTHFLKIETQFSDEQQKFNELKKTFGSESFSKP